MVVGIFRRSPLRGRRAVSFILATGLAFSSALAQAAAGEPFTNGGFEDSLLDAAPSVPDPWVPGGPNQVTAVDCEDGSDFQVYADTGQGSCDSDGGVAPFRGSQMLRLGVPESPGDQNNNQSDGDTTVSQTFQASSATLALTTRIFSTEFRRNRDAVTISVTDGATISIDVDLDEDGTTDVTCAGDSSCTIPLDSGRNGEIIASDWTQFTVDDMTPGTNHTLIYTLTTGGGDSHPSWVYFDDVNQPPNAQFTLGPGEPGVKNANGTAAVALEGDFVVADCQPGQEGGSSDPDGDDITCDWTASGGGLNGAVEQTGPVALFWFPDENPTPQITLTVTDEAGAESEVTTSVNLIGAEPVVGAVDLEVLDGQPGTTICRFLDAGIGNYGTAGALNQAELTGGASGASVTGFTTSPIVAEHDAEFSSGYVTATCAAGSCSAGTSYTCEITDADDIPGSDSFAVTVLTDVSGRFEPNETTAQADDCIDANGCGGTSGVPLLSAGSNYLARLEDPNDIDVFVIRNKNGDKFLPNADILLTLDVPADYELMVLAKIPDSTASPFYNNTRIGAPFYGTSYRNAPFYGTSYQRAPFYNNTLRSAPFYNNTRGLATAPFYGSIARASAFINSPTIDGAPVSSPFYNVVRSGTDPAFRMAFDQFPLSKVGLAVPDANAMLATDLDATDPGTLSLFALQSEPGLQIVDFSADVGNATERIMFPATAGVSEYYAAVFSTNGAYSSLPYSLRVEASRPALQSEVLAQTEYCQADDTFDATHSAIGYDEGAASAAVVVITQAERFQTVHADYFAQAETSWSSFISTVKSALGTSVAVVSVPGAWYKSLTQGSEGANLDGPDSTPCIVAARNALLEKIKQTYIQGELEDGSLQSIVVLGDRSVVPAYAVPDTTIVGNERDFALDVDALPGSWISTAVAEGYNSTYAFLGDEEPLPFQGRELWLEDVPIGVLTGEPDTILAELAATASTDNPQVFGYEAFADGAANNAALLSASTANINYDDDDPPWWGADAMRAAYNSESCPVPIGISNIYAHMTPGLLWSAEGYRAGNFSDVFSASEPKNCQDAGTITMSMGCHSGFNMPPLQSLPPVQGQGDPSRDWVDELGTYVAPIGYGLGDLFVADRVTEGLLTDVLSNFLGGMTLGAALVQAKHDYVLRVPEFDEHDEDSVINLTLFGAPNKMLAAGGAPTPIIANYTTSALTPISSATLDSGLTLDLTLYESGTATGLPTPDPAYEALSLTEYGDYYKLNPGNAFASYNRPLLPVTYGFEAVSSSDTDSSTPFNDVALVSRQSPGVNRNDPDEPDDLPDLCPGFDGELTRPCRRAGEFRDFLDNDPVFPFPQTNWSAPVGELAEFKQDEFDACPPNFGPFPLSFVSTLDGSQTQIIRGAQWQCTNAGSITGPGEARGTLRLYTSLHLDARQANVAGGAGNPAAVDRDPPQVLVQEFEADPITNDVTAYVKATDDGHGDSGICEVVVLVYHENVDTLTNGLPAGSGIVETYSSAYDVFPAPTGDLDNDLLTFNLEQGRGKRLATQAIDCDGNIAFKTLKGGLLQALDVQIVTAFVSLGSPTNIQVYIENLESLDFPTLTLEVCADGEVSGSDDCATELFALDELPECGTPAPGSPCITFGADGSGVVTIVVDQEDVVPSPTTVTATVRSQGAVGSDTTTLEPCTDAIGDTNNFADGDIQYCGFGDDGTDVSFDLILVDDGATDEGGALVYPPDGTGGVINADVQYRLIFPQFGEGVLIKYQKGDDPSNNGRVSTPPGVQVQVSSIYDDLQPSDVRGVRFTISRSELVDAGWDGISPIQYQFGTQAGNPKSSGEGQPDDTDIIVITLIN
jgi:hypothetical protein